MSRPRMGLCLGLLLLCAALEGRVAAAPTATPEPSGVVVEEVAEGFAAQQAGLRPGDLLLRWQRAAAPPANPQPARGDLASPFDLHEVETEQAPRGEVTLSGVRAGGALVVRLPPGDWKLKTRPLLGEAELETYEKARALLGKQEEEEAIHKGLALWSELASSLAAGGDPVKASWLFLKVATTAGERRDWQTADGAFDATQREAEASGEPSVRSMVADSLAGSLRNRNELERASAAYQAALAMRQERSTESLGIAKSLNNLGLVATSRGDLASAEDLYRRSLTIRKKLAPQSLQVAESLNNLGVVARDRGELASAADYYRRALDLKERLAPQSFDVAVTLINVGSVAFFRGDLASAEGYYRHSLDIMQRLEPESPQVAGILLNLGNVEVNRGDLASGEHYYRRALDIVEKLAPQSLNVAGILNNLGIVASSRGDLVSAEDHHRRSLEIRERLAPQSLEVAASLHSLGVVASDRGDLASAEDYYRRSVKLTEKLAPQSPELAASLENLGIVALRRDDLVKADDYTRRSLAIYEKLGPRSVDTADALRALGDVDLARSQLDSAQADYERSLAILRQAAPGSAEEAESCQRLAALHRRLGHLDRAIGFYDCVVAALEAQKGKLGGSDQARSTFGAMYAGTYREAIDLLVQVGKGEEAFHLLERYRARELLALLASRDLVFSSDLPEELATRRRVVNGDYDRAYERWMELGDDAGDEERQKAREELATTRRRQDEIRAEVRAAAPRLAALEDPQPLDLSAARAALDPGTLLLSYSVGAERSVLFAVGPQQGAFAVFPLAFGEAWLQDEVEHLREALDRGRFDGRLERYLLHARELSERLLAPAAAQIAAADRLLILADGPLHALPFAALTDPGDPGTIGRPHFLVGAKALHLAASATVFALLKQERRAHRSTLLTAFGDPQFPAAEPPDEQAAPQLRAALRNGLDFAPLPGTRAEVESLRRLYPHASRIYLGADATEEKAKAVGKDTTLLHIASHGVLDDRFPLDSALAFSIPAPWHEGEDNGLLQAWEIFEQLRIDADLVTLSGCDTGLGKVLGGEGLMGLTRAFQYAGARSVLASLWSVTDASVSELMQRFYGHLKEGESKAEALRSAQLELLHSSQYSHPYHWAAFELFGDWR